MAPNNPLTVWGNEKTMNLNPLILTNIQSSPYFKVQLFELKTFHEVVDEIYYKVEHLEPWEKGSRKTAGQTGMCGGVRGVGAGGIVSSAYCLLYKLFTLKLTKKQVNNLITHRDSPYIRGLGFMYIRYTQQPQDLWDWYDGYLDDDEELDVKAGGGHFMTIGEMLRQWLVKLEWYSTLFPRIPVPVQKDIDMKMRSRPVAAGFPEYAEQEVGADEPEHIPDDELSFGEAERAALSQRGRGSASNGRREDSNNGSSTSRRSPPPRRGSPPVRRPSPPGARRSPRRSPPRRSGSPRHSPYSRSGDDFSRELERERDRQRKEKEDYKSSKSDKRGSHSKEKDRKRSRSRSHDRKRSRSRERKRSRSRDRERRRSRSKDRKEHSSKHKERRKEEKKKSKHKDKDRERRH